MAACDVAAATTGTVLQLREGSLSFTSTSAELEAIPLACLQNSQLLQDLLGSTDVAASVELLVDVTPAALQLWVRHSQDFADLEGETWRNACTGGAMTARDVAALLGIRLQGQGSRTDDLYSRSGLSAQEACLLLTVADVLIDDRTKMLATITLTAMLLKATPERSSAVKEAVSSLPEHLREAIFHTLPDCLRHLHPSWHPGVLRAHHPSVDADATLSLSRLPIDTVFAALSAAATLTALRALSLAGLTLPLDPTPCIYQLNALPALTALNLHDIGIQQATADALAAVLPTLRKLRSLDLSNNRVTAPIMGALAPALRRCTRLRSLDLWDTLRMPGPHGSEELAAALKCLQLLTSLAIGVYTCGSVKPLLEPPTSEARRAILEALVFLPELAHLRLGLFAESTAIVHHLAAGFWAGLGEIAELRSLHCTVPPTVPSVQHQSALQICAPAQLTSLHLDFLARHASPRETSQLSSLRGLTRLKRLWLRVPLPKRGEIENDPCVALSEVLPCMLDLSHLELRTAPLTYNAEVGVSMEVMFVKGVIDAALSLPQLSVLHVPVFSSSYWLLQQLHVLLQAQGVGLSVDLYMRDLTHGGPAHAADAAGALVRLFPSAESLDVLCSCTHDVGLRRVVTDEAAALAKMSALRFGAWLETNECLDSSETHRPVVALLEKLSCLTQLRRLEVAFWNSARAQVGRSPELPCLVPGPQGMRKADRSALATARQQELQHLLQSLRSPAGARRSAAMCEEDLQQLLLLKRLQAPGDGPLEPPPRPLTLRLDRSGFLNGLQLLGGLTRLSLDVRATGSAFQEDLWRACAGLTNLQELDMGCHLWHSGACWAVLPQLPLRVLHVPRPAALWVAARVCETECPEGELAVGRDLPHVRCLVVPVDFAWDDVPGADRPLPQMPALQASGHLDRHFTFTDAR